MDAPAMSRYLGCTKPISLPVIGIMIMVTTPPGESTSPASIAV